MREAANCPGRLVTRTHPTTHLTGAEIARLSFDNLDA